MVSSSVTREARICNGEKTALSINGAGKPGHANVSNWTSFSHHIQRVKMG